jgi:hypothetical protein
MFSFLKLSADIIACLPSEVKMDHRDLWQSKTNCPSKIQFMGLVQSSLKAVGAFSHPMT